MRALKRLIAACCPGLCARRPDRSRAARGHEDLADLPKQNWSFDGPFGAFDLAAAQRGFQVYPNVCSNCHSMTLLHYRDLAGIGLIAGADQGGRRQRDGAARRRRPGPADGRAGHAGQPVPLALRQRRRRRARR